MLQKVDTTEILLCAVMYKGSDKDLLRPAGVQCCRRQTYDEDFLRAVLQKAWHTMKFFALNVTKGRYMIKFVQRSVEEGSRHTNCSCKMSQKVDIRRNRPIPSCHKPLFQSETVYMKMFFILMRIKLIFTTKILHLGNGVFHRVQFCKRSIHDEICCAQCCRKNAQ